MITLIAAVDRSMGIGRDGSIPWKSAADMSLFYRETIGGSVIMGRKTWESLHKVLQGRDNIVVSSTVQNLNEAMAFKDIDSAITAGRNYNTRVYGIGGYNIYKEMLPIADRILLTQIPGEYECDTFFPSFDKSEWLLRERKFSIITVHEYIRKEMK